MTNVFSLEQVATVLGLTVDDVLEYLVDMKVILNEDSMTVCDDKGLVMETFVRFEDHTETDLFLTTDGFKALVKEVYYV